MIGNTVFQLWLNDKATINEELMYKENMFVNKSLMVVASFSTI